MRPTRAKVEVLPQSERVPTALVPELKRVVVRHAGEIMAEVAPTLRRLRTLLLVATISVPVFMGALLVVLWHIAH